MVCKTPPTDLSFAFGFLDMEHGNNTLPLGLQWPSMHNASAHCNFGPLGSFVGFLQRAILENRNFGVVVIAVVDLIAVIELEVDFD